MKLMVTLLMFALAAAAQNGRSPDEFSTTEGSVKITPIQHASVMLQSGSNVIYIDTAQGSYDGLPKADLILITDIHGDHMAPAVLSRLEKPDTVIFAPEAISKTVTRASVINNGEIRHFGNWTIEAIPMYNLKRGPQPGQLFHTKGRGNGYVLSYGGKRFYFSGDTEGIPEMRQLRNIDVAFVCMNLPYTMTPEEAADAVKAFRPRVVYPYHFRGQDPAVFAKALQGSKIEVRVRDWYGG